MVEALRQGAQIGSMLARMRFDYPDQMLARVATDNEDGTYDCDRPGTLIYMSAVPVASISLAVHIVVGATVLIKFYNRDRRKPRIVAVAGGLGAEEAATFYWVSSHGTSRGSFLAGAESSIIDTTVASTWFAGPFGDNDQNNNFNRRPTLSMVHYPIGGVNHLVVLDGNVDATHHSLRAFILDGTEFEIAGDDTWTTSMTIASGSSGVALPGHLWMQYNADADLLIAMRRTSSFASGYTEIEFFDGASGASVGSFLNATDKHIFHLGWTTVGRYILRTYHAHTTAAYTTGSPTETGTQQKILGMELSAEGVSPVTLTPLWEFHPAQLFDSANTTAPAGAVIRGMLGDFVAPYLATQEAIVVPVAGHMPLANDERQNWAHFSKADLLQVGFIPAAGGYTLDTRECKAWLAALAVADGSVTWKYEFDALAADDTAHCVIDTSTFGTAAVRADYSSGVNYFNFTYIGLPDDQHYDTDVVTGINVTLARPDIGSQGVLGKLFPQYKYWQYGAGYHFDTTTEIQSGDPRSGLNAPDPTSTNAHIPADADDNTYMAYLQPYGVVSPIHPYLHPTVATVMLDSNYIGRCGAKVVGHPDTPTAGDTTYDYEVFDLPYRHTAWRSFLASWDSSGALRWRVELTFWGNDYQFSSASLAGEVPYAGSVLRIVPTSTVVFVLRTIRIPVAAVSTEDPTIQFGNCLDYAGHRGRRFCKTVLEAYTPSSGGLLWQEVLYDPRDDGSAVLPTQNRVASQPSTRYHCTGGVMYGSESGTPWVIGHFRHGTPDLEAASASKVFTANAAGLVSSRDATLKDILLVGNSGETNKFLPDAPHAIGDDSIWYPWRDDSDEMGVPAYAGKRRWHLRKMTA